MLCCFAVVIKDVLLHNCFSFSFLSYCFCIRVLFKLLCSEQRAVCVCVWVGFRVGFQKPVYFQADLMTLLSDCYYCSLQEGIGPKRLNVREMFRSEPSVQLAFTSVTTNQAVF